MRKHPFNASALARHVRASLREEGRKMDGEVVYYSSRTFGPKFTSVAYPTFTLLVVVAAAAAATATHGAFTILWFTLNYR